MLERNLVEVSIAVGQTGNGPKERPRRPGWRSGKCFVQFLLLSGLTGGANFGSNHHGLRILAVLDGSRRARSLGAPAPAVLMIVDLCNGK